MFLSLLKARSKMGLGRERFRWKRLLEYSRDLWEVVFRER